MLYKRNHPYATLSLLEFIPYQNRQLSECTPSKQIPRTIPNLNTNSPPHLPNINAPWKRSPKSPTNSSDVLDIALVLLMAQDSICCSAKRISDVWAFKTCFRSAGYWQRRLQPTYKPACSLSTILLRDSTCVPLARVRNGKPPPRAVYEMYRITSEIVLWSNCRTLESGIFLLQRCPQISCCSCWRCGQALQRYKWTDGTWKLEA